MEAYEKSMPTGKVLDLGTNYADAVEAWYVPTYLIKGDPERGIEPMAPDLKSIDDLPQYWELFKDPEAPTKGRFYSCIPGWFCEETNQRKFEAYELDKYYNLFLPGSDAALSASMVAAYEKGKPWFILSLSWCTESKGSLLMGSLALYHPSVPSLNQKQLRINTWTTILGSCMSIPYSVPSILILISLITT